MKTLKDVRGDAGILILIVLGGLVSGYLAAQGIPHDSTSDVLERNRLRNSTTPIYTPQNFCYIGDAGIEYCAGTSSLCQSLSGGRGCYPKSGF